MNDKFKTVTSGLGYNHNHMTRGQNIKVFHGVECPRCKHQFLPTCGTGPAKCPACGFEETAAPPWTPTKLLTQEDMAAAHRQADRDSDDRVDEMDYANSIERRVLHKLATMQRDQRDRLLAEAKNYIIDN